MDLEDARSAFAMEDAAGEILGFLPQIHYDEDLAQEIAARFNDHFNQYTEEAGEDAEFSPTMLTLSQQEGMAQILVYSKAVSAMLIFLFVAAMSIVLWNAGLLGGLRRYTEFGVRIALGESKSHIYRSLIWEALMIGALGSVLGSVAGIVLVYIFSARGFDFSGFIQNATILIPGVVRPAITPAIYYIGFIPGVFSMVLGNMLAGIGIYKRETSRLFNELDV
jgi:putative ABC transport system permease protein